jgi:hypothetical protein
MSKSHDRHRNHGHLRQGRASARRPPRRISARRCRSWGSASSPIDADIGLRNLDLVMGLENRILYDSIDVAEGRCTLQQAMVRDPRAEFLYCCRRRRRATRPTSRRSR